MKNPLVRLPLPLIRAFSALHRAAVRASRGRVGTSFRGQPMILLTTTGRRSGRPRTAPLVALPTERAPVHGAPAGHGAGHEEGGWVVVASNGGHDHHPAWYLNLCASPEAIVSDGRRAVRVRARDATPAERAAQYPRFVAVLSSYADYQAATTREIPVVFLEVVGPGVSGQVGR